MNIFALIVLIGLTLAQDQFDIATTTMTVMDIQTMNFEGEEPGSGGGEGAPACQFHYIKYDKTYLRGVKGHFHSTLNNKTFDECAEICCREASKSRCESFSYMKVLKQCFIMNVTQSNKEFYLEETSGHVHVQLVELPTTTPETKKLPFPSNPPRKHLPPPDRRLPIVGNKEPRDPAKMQSPEGCPACQNGGRCEFGQLGGYCACADGYEGDLCEVRLVEEEGFPLWLILVIVFAGLLILCLIIAVVVCRAHMKKSGQYQVIEALRDWARRTRQPKPALSSEDFFNDDVYSSPTKSVTSIYDTIRSTQLGPHANSTSV